MPVLKPGRREAASAKQEKHRGYPWLVISVWRVPGERQVVASPGEAGGEGRLKTIKICSRQELVV